MRPWGPRSELERHVERELAKVQHVLALLEMPAELVVQQYGALTDNPTPQGVRGVGGWVAWRIAGGCHESPRCFWSERGGGLLR